MTNRAASWLFRIAAIYGVIVLTPMYLLEPMLAHSGAPAMTRPEMLYGFVGASLAFQAVFWLIARDPLAYRTLMIVGAAYKWSFGVPAVALWLAGRVDGVTLAFGCVDLIWGAMFLVCRRLVRA